MSTEVCIIMASDYGIRHLIANFEKLITILKDETGLAYRSQVGTISKFTYGICSWSSGWYCIWHTIVNLAQILKYKTFGLACRSQVGGISKCTYGIWNW